MKQLQKKLLLIVKKIRERVVENEANAYEQF